MLIEIISINHYISGNIINIFISQNKYSNDTNINSPFTNIVGYTGYT